LMSALVLRAGVLFSTAARAEGGGIMGNWGPLSDGDKAIFFGTAEDPPAETLQATEKRLEGRHYVTCDEWNLHLFAPKIKDLGGGYAGVGTDQAYLFIGWQKPHLAWLMDYDPWVVYIHHAYAVFFREAATIEEFLAFWTDQNRKETYKLLKEKLAGHPDGKMIVKVFKHNRSHIERRLKKVGKQLAKEKIDSYLTNPATYDFVRQLVLNGRVRPMVGDLLADKGMAGIAEAGKQLGVPMRVLYLSNAEGYWKYGDQFRKNIISQFFDDASLVVRTVAAKWTNGDYRYNVQTGRSFQEYLKVDSIRSFRDIVPMGKLKGKGDIPLTFVEGAPPEPKDGK
jgi:hypothetical protein